MWLWGIFDTDEQCHVFDALFSVSFFFTLNGHSITQAWGGLGNQTGIEQPIKSNSLRNVLAVLAKKSENLLQS